jgi:hypothetical protein
MIAMRIIEKGCDPSTKLTKFFFNSIVMSQFSSPLLSSPLPQNLEPLSQPAGAVDSPYSGVVSDIAHSEADFPIPYVTISQVTQLQVTLIIDIA